MSKVGTALAFASAFAAVNAGAGVIYSEDFDYSGTSLIGQTGGTGFTGAWTGSAGTASGQLAGDLSLTFNNYVVASGGGAGSQAFKISGVGEDIAHRALASNPDLSGKSLYLSYLVRFDQGAVHDNEFVGTWYNAVTGPGSGIKGNQGNGSGPADIFGRPRQNSNVAAYSQDVTVGETYFVVGKLSKTGASTDFNTFDIWVYDQNDNIVATQPGVAEGTITNPGSGTVASLLSLGFRSTLIGVGGINDSVSFDRLRMGTDWKDVVPVPETGSLVAGSIFMLAGGTGMVIRRRKAAQKS